MGANANHGSSAKKHFADATKLCFCILYEIKVKTLVVQDLLLKLKTIDNILRLFFNLLTQTQMHTRIQEIVKYFCS